MNVRYLKLYFVGVKEMFNTLNKYLIFLLTAILLIAIGCEEDKTDTGPVPEVPFNFIGTWTVEYRGRDKFELTDCYGERPRWELTRQSLIP
jgi:hypothetical protein